MSCGSVPLLNLKLNYGMCKYPGSKDVYFGTNLEEAELIGRFVRPDDQSLDIANVDIATCHSKGCKV